MGVKASLHPIADKYLCRLNANDRDRIDDEIEGLEKEPPEGDIRPLKWQPGYFRLKVGGYRLLFRKNENGILITRIGPRGQAYSKKNKEGKR
jgi:mRNA interferase RelE/StbE